MKRSSVAPALKTLHEGVRALERQGIQVSLPGVPGPVRDALHADGLWKRIGSDNVVERIHDVMNQVGETLCGAPFHGVLR